MKLTLKKLVQSLAVFAALALVVPAAFAQKVQAPFSYSAITATNNAVVIIGPDQNPYGVGRDGRAGIPRVNFLNVTSDLATATVKFYTVGAPKVVKSASSGATNTVWFDSPVGSDFATSNQVIVVRRKAQNTTSRDGWDRLVSFTNTATSVTFTAVTGGAVNVNDEVYIATVGTQLLAGATASKEWAYNLPIWNGQANRPLLIEANATTLGKITALSGWWESFD